jgi:uncharacterized protein YjlB
MPAVIGYAAQAIAAYFFAGSVVAAAVIEIAIFAVLAVGVTKLMAEKPKFGDGFDSEGGQFVVSRGSVNTDHIAYGQTRKGGTLMFLDVTGPNNDYLWQAIHIIGHEIDSVQIIYFDDVAIPVSAINGSGFVTTGKYANRVQLFWHLGTDTQMANGAMLANFSADGRWTINDRARGNFYLVAIMQRDEPQSESQFKVFATGAPSAITVVFKASKVYDARLDSTVGGLGTHRQNDKSTWQWSDNNALCSRDYLCRGNSVNPFESGFAEDFSLINLSELVAAANRCDSLIEFPGGVFLKQYTCNGVLSTNEALSNNKEILEDSMLGKVFYSQGQWHIFAGGFDTPTVIVSARDFAGDISFMPTAAHDKRHNEVRGIYQNALELWRNIECLPRVNPSYQTDDGEYLPLTIKLPMTTHEFTAQYISFMRLQQTRNMQNFSALMKPRMIQVRPWDTVMVDVPMLNWNMAVFRAQNFKIDTVGLPDMLFKEESAALWTWVAANATARTFLNPVQPPVEVPPSPTVLVASSQPDNIHLKWTNPALATFEYIEVLRATGAQTFANATVIARVVADFFNDARPASLGQFRYWVQAVNRYGQASPKEPNTTTGVLSQSASITPNMTLVPRGNCVATAATIEKVGGVLAWDSDCYSLETFKNGLILLWQAAQTDKSVMIGLNSDPQTDQNFTSLDFAVQTRNDGLVELFESGVSKGVVGPYTITTQFAIVFDQSFVRFMVDGQVKLSTPVAGERSFFIDSSFFHPGGKVLNISLTPTAAVPVAAYTMAVRGNCRHANGVIQKVGGVAAWDSDCYSHEAYAGGCSVKFVAGQNNLNLMVGLNTDPVSGQSYETIDEAIYLLPDATWQIYRSGAQVAVLGAYAQGDTFEVRYDDSIVQYFRNGVLAHQVPNPGQVFQADSSFYNPGASVTGFAFGPLNSATLSPFRVRGGCRVADNNIQKVGGVAAWDSDAYSAAGYPSCHVMFKANAANSHLMVGLNTDPTVNSSYDTLDHAWHPASDGSSYIYESNVLVQSGGPYTPQTLFAITYDGTTVRYYKDNLAVAARGTPNAGKTFFMDSAFHLPGDGINSLRWGPTANLAVIDTSQIGLNAATDTFLSVVSVDQTVTVPGNGTLVSQQLPGYIALVLEKEYDYEVRVSSYAEKVSSLGNYTIYAGAGYATPSLFNSAGNEPIHTFSEGFSDTRKPFSFATVIHGDHFALAPFVGQTIRFGLGVSVSNSAGSAQDFTFKQAIVQVTRIKR